MTHIFSRNDFVKFSNFQKKSNLDITVNGRYGGAAHRLRITLCVNNMEALLLLLNVIIANTASLVCIRRDRWALICGDRDCESCRLDFLDCPGITKPYLFGLVAQALLSQMPLLDREKLLTTDHGRIYHNDVDWDRFYAQPNGT